MMKTFLALLAVLLGVTGLGCASRQLPAISDGDLRDLLADTAVEKIYVITNGQNRIELVLRADKSNAPSVAALKTRFTEWKGITPPHVPHLRMNHPDSPAFEKMLHDVQATDIGMDEWRCVKVQAIRR